ncbi:MAG: putative amidohydrolase [Frondihabitans sp.]|nr:putative amidohydrolase [Frondihabitans sp.]
MTRLLRVIAVQSEPVELGTPLAEFAADVARQVATQGRGTEGSVTVVVYPELHLWGTNAVAPSSHEARLRETAITLDDPLIADLGEIARTRGVWLLPGSVCERGPSGELFNTALVFAPDGSLVTSYRKVFPWRPSEPYDPGDEFVVFDIDGVGRAGVSICYDAWFPEVTRHLAWMGAEVVFNIVKTTTPDRVQEVLLAQANSIVNQTFTVSLNCAGPTGEGRSLVVDPEGVVLGEVGPDPAVLVHDLDLDDVSRVHEVGTAGVNRMWSQFRPGDAAIALPLYAGRIDPATWEPA